MNYKKPLLVGAVIAGLLATNAHLQTKHNLHEERLQRQQLEIKKQELSKNLAHEKALKEAETKAKTDSEAKNAELNNQVQKKDTEINELKQQVSMKQQAKLASYTKTAYTGSVSVTAISGSAKAFIYMHESGNNPAATNSQGCFGIGQDCNGIVRGRCGTNYACQDQYFSEYAAKRYGGWDGALAFWQSHRWW